MLGNISLLRKIRAYNSRAFNRVSKPKRHNPHHSNVRSNFHENTQEIMDHLVAFLMHEITNYDFFPTLSRILSMIGHSDYSSS